MCLNQLLLVQVSILAKGKNNMNKLVEIVICWSTRKIGFHTDVKKMYNIVQLRKEHWCFQSYIWQNELDNRKISEEKVIKTLIYGLKSSSNQSKSGLRETAHMSAVEFPKSITLYRRIYMLMIVCLVHKI